MECLLVNLLKDDVRQPGVSFAICVTVLHNGQRINDIDVIRPHEVVVVRRNMMTGKSLSIDTLTDPVSGDAVSVAQDLAHEAKGATLTFVISFPSSNP